MSRKQSNILFANPKNPNASKLHCKVLTKVKNLFPGYTVLEEQSIAATDRGRRCNLPIDIVIKELHVAIECQGQQHYAFNSRFHRSIEDFEDQKRRDRAKAEAVSMAGWAFITIAFNEIDKLTENQLARRITKAIQEA